MTKSVFAVAAILLPLTVQLSAAELGGTAPGLEPRAIICENTSSGQRIVSPPTGHHWSCSDSGLRLETGDEVRVGVAGSLPGGSLSGGLVAGLAEDFAVHEIENSLILPVNSPPVAADLDADGDLDAVITSRFSWFENRGGVPLDLAPRQFAGDELSLNYIHAADLDGDGDTDLVGDRVIAAQTRHLLWYTNDGAQSPTFEERLLFERQGFGFQVAGISDIDGDGENDVVAMMEQEADPPCQHALIWLENRETSWFPHTILTFPASCGSFLFATWVLDVDDDGDHDTIVRRSGDGIHPLNWRLFWLENEGGLFTTEHRLLQGFVVGQVSQADLDGDGDSDLLVKGHEDTPASDPEVVLWLENRGGLRFERHDIFASNREYSMAVGDFSGDALPDVVLTEEGFKGFMDFFVWLENQGGSPVSFLQHDLDIQGAAWPVIADMNGDQRLDILDTERGVLRWFENQIGVGLSLAGMVPSGFVCHNRTTGDSVAVESGAPTVDCASAGLEMSPGDEIEVLAEGIVR